MTEVGLATLNPPARRRQAGIDRDPGPRRRTSRSAEDGGDAHRPRCRSVASSSVCERLHGGLLATQPRPRAKSSPGEWLDWVTSPAPTRTGTCGSSVERSRSSSMTARTSARSRSKAPLLEHPAIGLAGVVGVHDRHARGDRSARTSPSADGAARPSSAELILFCRDRIGYKAPEEIVFMDEMPLNPDGQDRPGRTQADRGGRPAPSRPRARGIASAERRGEACRACSVPGVPFDLELHRRSSRRLREKCHTFAREVIRPARSGVRPQAGAAVAGARGRGAPGALRVAAVRGTAPVTPPGCPACRS